MKSFVVYVATCSRNCRRARTVKQHLDTFQVPYHFVYGQQSDTVIEPALRVDCVESYSQLIHKTRKIIEHFVYDTDAEYLIKIDDDTFLDATKLPPEMFEYDYGGCINAYEKRKNTPQCWNNYKMLEYGVDTKYIDVPNVSAVDYANGGFYFLSRAAATFILTFSEGEFTNTPETYLGEDLKIGTVIAQNKDLKILDMRIESVADFDITTNYSSIHPVSPIMFSKLNKCSCGAETAEILKKYNFLNTHNKINNYLNTRC